MKAELDLVGLVLAFLGGAMALLIPGGLVVMSLWMLFQRSKTHPNPSSTLHQRQARLEQQRAEVLDEQAHTIQQQTDALARDHQGGLAPAPDDVLDLLDVGQGPGTRGPRRR